MGRRRQAEGPAVWQRLGGARCEPDVAIRQGPSGGERNTLARAPHSLELRCARNIPAPPTHLSNPPSHPRRLAHPARPQPHAVSEKKASLILVYDDAGEKRLGELCGIAVQWATTGRERHRVGNRFLAVCWRSSSRELKKPRSNGLRGVRARDAAQNQDRPVLRASASFVGICRVI